MTKDSHHTHQTAKRRKTLKDYLPKSLFGRTILIIIAPVLLLQLTATIVFFDRHWVKMTERLSDAVAGELATICTVIEESNADPYIIEGLSNVIAYNQEIILTFADGETLSHHYKNSLDILGLSNSFAKALRNKIHRPFEINVDFSNKQIDVWIQLDQGVLHATMPERRLYSSSGYIFILWLIGLSILFFAISVWLMRNQIRPIYRLASAANRLGKGQDVSFFKPTGAREVRQAAESFLKMRERIRRQVEQRTAMLAGVSHDLRTPITRLKIQTEMMSGLPPTEQDIRDMQADLNEMESMIDAYLSFAKGMDAEESISTDIVPLLQNLAQRMKEDDKQIKITALEASLPLTLRPQQITRAFNNIIGNALKYADSLDIVINKNTDKKEVTITFTDDGPGIPEEEQERVFRPFYRIEGSRSKKTGGVGLGLSIAQDIINGHGGRIYFESQKDSPESGLTVVVKLPL